MAHQNVAINSIKELFQIECQKPTMSCGHMGAGGLNGLVGAFARTEAEPIVREQRVEDRRELLQQCLLDQTI